MQVERETRAKATRGRSPAEEERRLDDRQPAPEVQYFEAELVETAQLHTRARSSQYRADHFGVGRHEVERDILRDDE